MTACQFHKVGDDWIVSHYTGTHLGRLIERLSLDVDDASGWFFVPRGRAPSMGSRVMLSIGRKLAELNRAEPPTERA